MLERHKWHIERLYRILSMLIILIKNNLAVLDSLLGLKSNLNKFLSSYGIEVNEDALLRTVYYKFLHPKEVLITSGVKSKLFQKTVEKLQEQKKGKKSRNFETEDEEEDGNRDFKFPFVYVAFELDSTCLTRLAQLNSPNSNTLDTRTAQHSTQKDPHYLFSTLDSSPIP